MIKEPLSSSKWLSEAKSFNKLTINLEKYGFLEFGLFTTPGTSPDPSSVQ